MEKIVIPTANGILCSHFGHCEKFYIAEVDQNGIINESYITPPQHEPGLYPAWVREHGATIVISGGMGQKAQDLFAQQNIKVIVGANNQDPRTIVKQFLQENLQTGGNQCSH